MNLMYNPAGAYLPPEQEALEELFHRELTGRFGIHFHRLLTLVNMPIGRFKEFLKRSKNYDRYMGKLVAGFNQATVGGLMCRSLISTSWDGRLFDCDFNQALDLPLLEDCPRPSGTSTCPAWPSAYPRGGPLLWLYLRRRLLLWRLFGERVRKGDSRGGLGEIGFPPSPGSFCYQLLPISSGKLLNFGSFTHPMSMSFDFQTFRYLFFHR